MTARAHGIVPLPSKPFALLDAVTADPAATARFVAHHGSPVHVLDPAVMRANAAGLLDAARDAGVDARLFFARKANKADGLMRAALDLGLGVDVSSEGELEQVLAAGAGGDDLIVTAAVKTDALLRRAREVGARPALDHRQEAERWVELPAGGPVGRAAVRLAPEGLSGIPTRFGMRAAEVLAIAADPRIAGAIDGVQLHVDGYAAQDRIDAAGQAIALADALRELGHPVAFIDLGGGVPMRYVDDPQAWTAFWDAHRTALLDGDAEALTFRRHGLGLTVAGGEVHGAPAVYPVAQSPVAGGWLTEVLAGRAAGTTVAAALRARGLRLHLEPGRALLDGCGVTIARVAFTKDAVDGMPLAGLEMNRTQLRSAADDFLVDPVVLRPPGGSPDGAPITACLVGAYCIERELITWRRLRFPLGIAPDDLVVFPNTAGYLMHIVESPSHGMPLASNVLVDSAAQDWTATARRDLADHQQLTRP